MARGCLNVTYLESALTDALPDVLNIGVRENPLDSILRSNLQARKRAIPE